MGRVIRWAILLLLVGAGVGWWKFQEVWSQRHALLAGKIRARLIEIAPDWDINFQQVELLDDAVVRLTDLHVAPRGKQPLIEIPEMHLQLDRKLLSEGLQVLITKADVRHPVLHIARDAEGRWNWQDLPAPPQSDAPTPQIRIEGGIVALHLAGSELLPPTEFQLSNIDAELGLTAYRQYELKGRTSVDTAGALSFEGTLDLRTRKWSLIGSCQELHSPDGLLELAAGLSPTAREQLQSLARRTEEARLARGPTVETQPSHDGPPVRTASGNPGSVRIISSHDSGKGEPATRCEIPVLGVAAALEFAFALEGNGIGSELDYRAAARIRDGVIDNPALPVPLYDLQGEFFIDRSQLIIRELQAANGGSRLFVDGRLSRDEAAPARSFVVKAVNLSFGREIHRHLWGGLKRLYETLHPAGRFNLDVAASTDGLNGWQVTLNRFEAYDCSVLPDVFQYPIHGVNGRIWQEGERFLIDFKGQAEETPVVVRGEFQNPGPNLSATVNIQADDVPVDERLRHALTGPQQATARSVLEKLRLRGRGDARVRLVKPPAAPLLFGLDVRVKDAALNYEGFPYEVTGLSGHLLFDPMAKEAAARNVWRFSDLKGRHGAAQISGSGSFTADGANSLLDLRLTAMQAAIDEDLALACSVASPHLRQAFESIGRAGAVDLENLRVLWSPSRTPVVSLPSIVVKDARLQLAYFPFVWDQVTGSLSWEQGRLSISTLSGWHSDAYLQIDGNGDPTAAMVEFPDAGDVAWHVHLEEVRLRQVRAEGEFRDAFAATGLTGVIDSIGLQGIVDLNLGLDLKGFHSQPDVVTAAWDLQAELPGNRLSVGLDLEDVSGRIDITRGLWDGRKLFIDGHFDLRQARALNLPLTSIRGPFLVDGDDVFVGMPSWPEIQTSPSYDPQTNPFAGQQAQADVYGGRIGIDVQARLSQRDPEQTNYRASVTLRDAELSQWAQANGMAGERLRGPVNGKINVIGTGSSDKALRGSGWVMISPAQLYELPVLNRTLASLELRQPDTTAFRYAYGEFSVHDGLFDFSKIDLVGESLRLAGRGTVEFSEELNERLDIHFYRSKFRNRIPIVGQVISAVTQNSIGVRVGGTVSNPDPRVQAKLGIVDDSLRNMIESFNDGQMPGLPRQLPLMGQPLQRGAAPFRSR